jgi:hypothetical protein
MSEPTYSYTTIDKIVARLKIRLGLENTNTQDFFLRDCVIEAAKEMSTAQDFVQNTAVLEICDFKAQLPCDFVRFNRGSGANPPLVFTENGVAINRAFYAGFQVVWTDGPFLTALPYPAVMGQGLPTMNIQDGYIYFSNNIDALECTISYLAINLDEAGKLKIPANNERPIFNFGMYQWAQRNGEPASVYQDYNRLWTQGKLEKRGLSKLLDTFQRDKLIAIMNA